MSELCTIYENEECIFDQSINLLRKIYLIENQINNEYNENIYNLVINIKEWKEIYVNDFFYDLSGEHQVFFLIQIKNYFLSIFDCSLGGDVFHFKLMKIFEKDNYNYKQIMEDIVDRLKKILEIVGVKIFEYLEIPLIKHSQLYILDHNQIIKYLSTIFIKIKELLEKTIELFKEFYEVCKDLII
jgi:hypothetical protein